jgi:TPR repeat protein
MNKLLKQVLLVGLCVCALTRPAIADSLSSAVRAYDAGIYTKALKLLKPLAQHGDASAQFYLGLMYGAGQGVPQDYVLAHMWVSIAAAKVPSGEVQQNAASYRDSIENKMTAQQIAMSQKITRKCTSNKFKGCSRM